MKRPADSKFRTHIAEPRWQRVVSVAIVLAFIVVELVVALRH